MADKKAQRKIIRAETKKNKNHKNSSNIINKSVTAIGIKYTNDIHQPLNNNSEREGGEEKEKENPTARISIKSDFFVDLPTSSKRRKFISD